MSAILKYSIYDSCGSHYFCAGMAGLAATLQRLTDNPHDIQWQITRNTLEVAWQGDNLEVMTWLLEQAYQFEDGLLKLTNGKNVRKLLKK